MQNLMQLSTELSHYNYVRISEEILSLLNRMILIEIISKTLFILKNEMQYDYDKKLSSGKVSTLSHL